MWIYSCLASNIKFLNVLPTEIKCWLVKLIFSKSLCEDRATLEGSNDPVPLLKYDRLSRMADFHLVDPIAKIFTVNYYILIIKVLMTWKRVFTTPIVEDSMPSVFLVHATRKYNLLTNTFDGKAFLCEMFFRFWHSITVSSGLGSSIREAINYPATFWFDELTMPDESYGD
jgi:hypothetical protein